MFAKGPGGTFTAVDFDTRRLRVVQVEVNGKGSRVKKMRSEELPADLNVADPKALGAYLGQVLREMRLASTGILMHVPRGQAVLKPLSLPNVGNEDDLPGMVRYQVEKELPFSGEQAVIDFALGHHFDAENPSLSNDGRLDVLVAAVHTRVVEHYRQIAEAAGVKLRRLGLRPYANMCCVDACRVIEPGQCVAVVHLTAEETEIDVFSDQTVHFSRSAVVRLVDRSQPAAEGTGEETAAADDAQVARADKTEEPYTGSETPDPVEQLVMEITRSLKSYHAVQRGRGIRKILIAGDTGVELQLVRRLAMEFDVPCARFSPAAGLQLEEDDPDASAYISAFGLAIGQAARDGYVPFDFLNPKKPVQKVDPRKRNLILGGVAAALVLGVTVFATASHISTKNAELNALISKSNELSREVRTGQTILTRVRAVEKWTDASRDWLGHWAQISALFPPATEAYITSMRSSSESSINLSLRARTSETITDLGERLAEAGYEFRPGPVTTVTDPHGYVYNTTIRIIINPKMKIDVDELPPVQRPADDASAMILNGRGGAVVTSTSSGDATAAERRPAAAPPTQTRPQANPPGGERRESATPPADGNRPGQRFERGTTPGGGRPTAPTDPRSPREGTTTPDRRLPREGATPPDRRSPREGAVAPDTRSPRDSGRSGGGGDRFQRRTPGSREGRG